jgi:uncharacterized protein
MQLEENTLRTIKESVSNVIGGDFDLYLFGSRARGTARKYSDVDMALKSTKPITMSNILKISSDIDDTNIAYKVDIVDYAKVPKALKMNIDADGVRV